MQKHNRRKSGSIPAPRVRVCPSCEKILLRRPSGQRFCSANCYSQWRLNQARNRRKPPRFDLLIDRTPAADERPDEELSWAARGSYWEAFAAAALPEACNRGEALVVTGHGVKLRIDGGTLLIDEGLTQYPQARRQHRYFPGGRNLPGRIVLLGCDGFLTLDVLSWIARQNVALLVLDWDGHLRTTVGLGNAAYDSSLHTSLLSVAAPKKVALARWLIESKIKGCCTNLESFEPSPMRSLAISNELEALSALKSANTLENIRLVEARAAAAYFGYWQRIPIRWKGTIRYPVPVDWLTVGPRQSFHAGSNRNATQPAHAMLNYAFALLEGQVRLAAAEAGLVTNIGILHASRPNRSALILDLIEPLRPLVECTILNLIRDHTFARKDFIVSEAGVCKLHPQLARVVVKHRCNEDKVIELIKEFANRLRAIEVKEGIDNGLGIERCK